MKRQILWCQDSPGEIVGDANCTKYIIENGFVRDIVSGFTWLDVKFEKEDGFVDDRGKRVLELDEFIGIMPLNENKARNERLAEKYGVSVPKG